MVLKTAECRPGPSCSKLTMSLVNDSLKFTSSDTQIFWYFLLKKMWVAFAVQKLLTFFQQKISKYCILNPLKQLTKWPLTSDQSHVLLLIIFLGLHVGLGTAKNKVPWCTAVFSKVPWYVPRYTKLNFAEITVKLPAVVAIWLICQHLMVYQFKPPQSSVLSFIFNEILIYIVYCYINLYFKLKISSG